jgi:hypothetical protein
VAIVLAIFPYFLVRGPVNRLVKWRMSKKPQKPKPEVAAS